jgi:hypothetical protein
MTQWDGHFPEKKLFLYNLKRQLAKKGLTKEANLLSRVIDCSSFMHSTEWRHDGRPYAINKFYVPINEVDNYTEEILSEIERVVPAIMTQTAPFWSYDCGILPILEVPPEDENIPLNNASLGSNGTIQYDKLRFRSKTETKIYDELKKRKVLFFPNAICVLGGIDKKKEPDFLVCHDGKWGILEINGDDYHTPANSTYDHERARLFQIYGLSFIQFYDAHKCYTEPEKVVTEFLTLLAKQKS